MRINAVISHKPRVRLLKKGNDRIDRQLLLLTSVLAAGLAFGVFVFLLKRELFLETLSEQIASFQSGLDSAPFLKRFFFFLRSDLPLFAAMLVCGTSVIGAWALLPLLFVKAGGIAALACVFIQGYQMQGVAAFFGCVFPGKSVLLLSLLMMGQNCLHTAAEIGKSVEQEGRGNEKLRTLFELRSLVSLLIIILANLLNAGLPPVFMASLPTLPAA